MFEFKYECKGALALQALICGQKIPRNCTPFEVEFDLEQAILNA